MWIEPCWHDSSAQETELAGLLFDVKLSQSAGVGGSCDG